MTEPLEPVKVLAPDSIDTIGATGRPAATRAAEPGPRSLPTTLATNTWRIS